MDLDYIKKLAQLLKDHDLSEVTIEENETKVRLRRGAGKVPQILPAFAEATTSPVGGAPVAEALDAADGTLTINSPIVGTFYRSPAPDSDPFVEVGASVEEETTVAIVEAMKVMNEIKAEVRGEITSVLVEDGDPVQFGTPLFKVSAL